MKVNSKSQPTSEDRSCTRIKKYLFILPYIVLLTVSALPYLPSMHFTQNLCQEFLLITSILHLLILCCSKLPNPIRLLSSIFVILVLVQLNTAARARYDIDDIVTEFPNAKIEVLELPMAYNGATLYKRAFKLRRFLARIKHKQEPFYLVVNVSSSWFTSLDQKLKEVPGMQEIQAPTLGALMPFSSQPKIYFRKTGNFFIY